MDVMEEMTSAGIAEISTIDRAAVAGSLDRLADYLAAILPGKLAIISHGWMEPTYVHLWTRSR